MTFQETVKKIDESIPSKPLTVLMVTIGVVFIIVGLYGKSNILKATMITYAIVP